MAKTEFTEYRFTVKEGHPFDTGGKSTPYLMCEPMTKELGFLGNDGFVSIRLNRGTTISQAKEIANYLKQCVAGISITTF